MVIGPCFDPFLILQSLSCVEYERKKEIARRQTQMVDIAKHDAYFNETAARKKMSLDECVQCI